MAAQYRLSAAVDGGFAVHRVAHDSAWAVSERNQGETPWAAYIAE